MNEEKKKIIWVPDKSKPQVNTVSTEVLNARKIVVPGKNRAPDAPVDKNGSFKAPADGLGS